MYSRHVLLHVACCFAFIGTIFATVCQGDVVVEFVFGLERQCAVPALVGVVPGVNGGNSVGVNAFAMEFKMVIGCKILGADGAVEDSIAFEVTRFGEVNPFDL